MTPRESRACWAALSPAQQADLGSLLLLAATAHLEAKMAATHGFDAAVVRDAEWRAETANASLVAQARGALVLTASVEVEPPVLSDTILNLITDSREDRHA